MLNSLKLSIRDFSNKTGIKAFGFASSAISLTERRFWYLIIIVCVCLTVYEVTTSVTKYLSCPLATNVEFSDNESLNLGTPTFCFELQFTHIAPPQILSDTNLLISFLDSLGNITDTLENISAEVKRNRDQDNATISGRHFDLVYLLLLLISNVVGAEHFVSDAEQFNYSWEIQYNFDSEENLTKTEDFSLGLAVASFHLSQKGYRVSDLLPVVGEIICNDFVFTSKHTGSNGVQEIDSCGRSHISSLGISTEINDTSGYAICMNLVNELLHFEMNEFSFFSMKHNRYKVYQKEDDVNDNIYMIFGGQLVGDLNAFGRVKNYFCLPYQSTTSITVMVQAELRKVSTHRKPCLQEGNNHICKLHCRLNYIRSKCGCEPVSGFRNAKRSNLIECGAFGNHTNLISALNSSEIPGFVSCPLIRNSPDPDKFCSTACPHACRTVTLFFLKTTYETNANLSTQLWVNTDTFAFLVVKEVELLGPKELLAFLGSNLSFYLGANFIVILHAVIYWLQVVLTNKRARLQLVNNEGLKVTGWIPEGTPV